MYWSGFTGAFILDDTPNLNVINQLPDNPSLGDFLGLATTGFAGILGRPISIFSFLLQYESWPDPRNFKIVNLLIHLVNGALIALLCTLIGKQWRARPIPVVAIAAITFIWLAHPIQVSSVMYVVQRMTLLSTTFTLLSIVLYLFGRMRLDQNESARGIASMMIGLIPVALLAVLSKENGALIFLYVLVLEYTLFSASDQSALLLRFRRDLLGATVLIGVVGMVYIMPSTLEGYELKPFSFIERVSTQFPVIITYLASIALLLPNHFGVFHDDVANAQGFTLFLSILLIVSLIGVALIRRRQWPLFAFAVLWFFAGHALESTFLPLEYYFEHRNYLPLLGPIFAVVVFLSDVLPGLDSKRRNSAFAIMLLILVFMSAITVRQTSLWGDPLGQAYAAAQQHPDSKRAQSNLVEKLSASGQFQAAFDHHMEAIDRGTASISPYVRWLEFSCILPDTEPPEDEILIRQARDALHDYGTVFTLNNLSFGILEGRCPSAPIGKLQLLLAELAANSNFAESHADIIFYQALLQAFAEDFTLAASLAEESFRQRADVRVAIYQLNWLIRSGQIAEADAFFELLQENYSEQIAASAEHTARLEFLVGRLAEENEL